MIVFLKKAVRLEMKSAKENSFFFEFISSHIFHLFSLLFLFLLHYDIMSFLEMLNNILLIFCLH